MLQLVFAYLFAAGISVTVVYFAKQNRKQGWQRPAPRWFGVELETRATGTTAAGPGTGSEDGELLPQLLTLNRELASHGTPIKGDVVFPKVESSETPELVSTRRV